MSYGERLGLIVDAEWTARENKRVERALKEAKLRLSDACIEGIEYSARREIDKSVIKQLASCRWIEEHQSILITGATGTGKTYLGCALAHHACRKGYRASYRRAPRFFDELRLARADGSHARLLARIARVDVLLLDDFAIAPMTDHERRDLLEILEDLHGLLSTILSSQLDPGDWHDYLVEPNLAHPICHPLCDYVQAL